LISYTIGCWTQSHNHTLCTTFYIILEHQYHRCIKTCISRPIPTLILNHLYTESHTQSATKGNLKVACLLSAKNYLNLAYFFNKISYPVDSIEHITIGLSCCFTQQTKQFYKHRNTAKRFLLTTFLFSLERACGLQ